MAERYLPMGNRQSPPHVVRGVSYTLETIDAYQLCPGLEQQIHKSIAVLLAFRRSLSLSVRTGRESP